MAGIARWIAIVLLFGGGTIALAHQPSPTAPPPPAPVRQDPPPADWLLPLLVPSTGQAPPVQAPWLPGRGPIPGTIGWGQILV
jgi:hypothetical protein